VRRAETDLATQRNDQAAAHAEHFLAHHESQRQDAEAHMAMRDMLGGKGGIKDPK